MKAISYLEFLFTLQFAFAALLPKRPVIFFHGFMASCQNTQNGPLQSWICIETGTGSNSMKSLKVQAMDGCLQVTNLIFSKKAKNFEIDPRFEYGFHLVGFSQGGIIARLIFETCSRIRPFIKRLYTFGTPNLGISALPKSHKNKNEEKTIFDTMVNFTVGLMNSWIQNPYGSSSFSFLEYYNGQDNLKSNKMALLITEMLENQINLEENKDSSNKQFQKRPYRDLEFMMNVMFLRDKMILPHSSMIFGIEFNRNTKEFSDFRRIASTRLKEKLGLEELYSEGKMWNCIVDGEHVELNDMETAEFLVTFTENCEIELDLQMLKDIKAENPKYKEKLAIVNDSYKKCLWERLNSIVAIGLFCDRGSPDIEWKTSNEKYSSWISDKIYY